MGFCKRDPVKFLPFIPEFAEAVPMGIKSATSRNDAHRRPYYPRAGEMFEAHCRNRRLPGAYKCLAVVRTTLQTCRDQHWKAIGVCSPEHYVQLWEQVHRRAFDGKQRVWLYIFDRIS